MLLFTIRSYSSSTGALIKAPQFTHSEGSPLRNPEANGLFKLHVHVTDSGFIFINFNAAPLEPTGGHNPLEAASVSQSLAMTKGTKSAGPSIAVSFDTCSNESRAVESYPSPVSPSSDGFFEGGLDSDSDNESLFTAPDSPPSNSVPSTPNDFQPMRLPDESPDTLTNTKYTVRFEEHFGSLPSEWSGFSPDEYEYAYSW